MTDIDFNLLLRIVALGCYLVILATWPRRKQRVTERLGKLVLPLTRTANRLMVPALVLAPLLILFQWFRDFGLMIHAVLCAVAVLAAELVVRERVLGAMAGVYQKGLVVDGRLLLFSDIHALPTLSYEDELENQDEFYRRTLEVVTENSGTIRVSFASRSGTPPWPRWWSWSLGWASNPLPHFKSGLRNNRYTAPMVLRLWARMLVTSLWLLLCPPTAVFSEDFSFQDLLADDLANHREIQSMMMQLEQRQLASRATEISQGVKVSLSTGTISIGSSQVRSEPALSIKLPQLNATYVEAKVPIQMLSQQPQSENVGKTGTRVEGASLSIGTEILGGSGKTARLTLLKSQRSLLEAQRAVKGQALTVEKEFYAKVKELYSSYASLLAERNTAAFPSGDGLMPQKKSRRLPLPLTIALLLAITAAIGIFFGLSPASRAARLDPVEALASE